MRKVQRNTRAVRCNKALGPRLRPRLRDRNILGALPPRHRFRTMPGGFFRDCNAVYSSIAIAPDPGTNRRPAPKGPHGQPPGWTGAKDLVTVPRVLQVPPGSPRRKTPVRCRPEYERARKGPFFMAAAHVPGHPVSASMCSPEFVGGAPQ